MPMKYMQDQARIILTAASGMDAVILDVTDEELVNALLTADLVMNRSIYADSYLEAFRS